MKILFYDTETSSKPKENPYRQDNGLCVVGWQLIDNQNYPQPPYREAYYDDKEGQEQFKQDWKAADLIVGFNLKFDGAWVYREFGLEVEDHQKVYDVQLAWFILTNQQHRYPSLNQVLEYFGLSPKLDVVKTQYWDKGIDTFDVPRPILSEYLQVDVEQTAEAYYRVVSAMPQSKRKLVMLANMDLLVLLEMERTGMLYDREKSLELAEQETAALNDIDKKLTDIVGMEGINFGSGQQLSAVLYGGTISQEEKEDYLFTYKDPKKPPVLKQRKVERQYHLPRLVEPLPKTETKLESKAGDKVYFTNEPTLKSLKAKGKAKSIIELVLERATREKLVSSYYHGIPKIMDSMNWPENEVHGNLNQCTVVTGRLSSDKPNMQNLDINGKKLFYSRYTE